MSELADRFNPKGLDYPENEKQLKDALSVILGIRKDEKHPDNPDLEVDVELVEYNSEDGSAKLRRTKECGKCPLGFIGTQNMVNGGLSDTWADIEITWIKPDNQDAQPQRAEAPANHPHSTKPVGGINFG